MQMAQTEEPPRYALLQEHWSYSFERYRATENISQGLHEGSGEGHLPEMPEHKFRNESRRTPSLQACWTRSMRNVNRFMVVRNVAASKGI